MREILPSSALAVAWEFRRRHRFALIALAGYALAFAILRLLFLGPEQAFRLDPPNGTAGAVIAPVSVAVFYLLAVFSFGLGGDVAARESMFPARMFTLPVTTRALAGWPMLFGAWNGCTAPRSTPRARAARSSPWRPKRRWSVPGARAASCPMVVTP